MNREKGEFIKTILLTTPDNGVACAAHLTRMGVSYGSLKQYIERGYLDSVGRGAYCKHGHHPTLAAALSAATNQLGTTVHLGGWSALAQHGLLHFLPAEERLETLYAPTNQRLPAWMESAFGAQYVCRHTNFLPEGMSVERRTVDGFDVPVSMPERAILEYLLEVPAEHPVSEAYQIMEMMVGARPGVMQKLLERCGSIKAKRLFFLLAEDLNLSWYEDLDAGKVDLGSGNRVVDSAGTYREKWMLTVKDWRDA